MLKSCWHRPPPVPASPQAHGRLPALVRINLKAAGQIDARHFCFTRGLVGMGWQVECDAEAQGPVLTWSHYVRLAQALYGAVWAPVQKLHDLPQGSIVWTREGYGDKTRFHVGMVVGPWRYLLEDREAEKADIVNVRDILWKEVGGYAAVPGGVARSFTPSTFQSIRDAEAISFSTTPEPPRTLSKRVLAPPASLRYTLTDPTAEGLSERRG